MMKYTLALATSVMVHHSVHLKAVSFHHFSLYLYVLSKCTRVIFDFHVVQKDFTPAFILNE